MKIIDLLEEHIFHNISGLYVYRPTKEILSIHWATLRSQILHERHGETLRIDTSRDGVHLHASDGDTLKVFRIAAADRIIHGKPWKELSIYDANLFKELKTIIRYL